MQNKNNYNLEDILRKFAVRLMVFLVFLTQILPYPAVEILSLQMRQTAVATTMGESSLTESDEDITEAIDAGENKEITSSDEYDLVALIVENRLYSDNNQYEGSTIRDRVLRYAEDVTAANELTDTLILQFDRDNMTVSDLATALENLYLYGDESGRNRLAGVVLVGDIPLPVVNKNGNKFISLFPYTDFVDKAYPYNSATKSFERNPNVIFTMPEIWHGVIAAPKGSTTEGETLAEYFDKNHAYYQGDEEFANFDRKMLFADLVQEEKALNDNLYGRYLQYLDSMEDLAYKRFNKFWANDLAQATEVDVTGTNSGGSLASSPDIHTVEMINANLMSYMRLLPKYMSSINEWVLGTGRYQIADVDTVPALIDMKDLYTRSYLKNVNDALEKQVNAIVEQIQEPLPLVEYSVLSGSVGNQPFVLSLTGENVGSTPAISQLVYRFHYFNEVLGKMFINGVDADVLQGPLQCSQLLGSTKSEYFDSQGNFNPKAVNGEYSLLTQATRTDNRSTALPVRTTGVNTRMLGIQEAKEIAGVESIGALIEDNLRYGISAFAPNPLIVGYKNPLEGVLQRGDLIVKVNGESLTANLTYEQSIEKAYQNVKTVLDAVNGRRLDLLEGYPYPVRVLEGDNLSDADAITALGNLKFEFYRGGEIKEALVTFTVERDGRLSGNQALGNPEMFVQLNEGPVFYEDFSNAAIFSLNSTFSGALRTGYGGDGYDNAAGCSQNAAGENPDRCFPMLATMPILDPAGTSELVNINNVDETLLNSCYQGLPTTTLDLKSDSNPYLFPLDSSSNVGSTNPLLQDNIVNEDLLRNLGEFVKNYGYDRNISPFRDQILLNLDQLDAAKIVLSNFDGQNVTLKEFSDRYGLFDGIDNDGDGVRDFSWVDSDNDGIADRRSSDLDEAAPQYGIPSQNLDEIARKLLSKRARYIIPASINGFNSDLVLNTNPGSYRGKNISSVVIHNEPTDYTISQQVKSGASFILPIDDPRYIAFQSEPPTLSPNPAGGGEQAYFPPGQTERIDYVNLFKVDSYFELTAELNRIADKIAITPGSYRIFGENAVSGQYTPEQIKAEILNKYLLPVVDSDADSPASGFDLDKADGKKIADNLAWKSMGVDEKHAYILENYLSPDSDAYINDKNEGGYEMAYLVLDGEGGDSEEFQMNFNKDLPDETDARFNPLILEDADLPDSQADEPLGPGETPSADGRGGTTEEGYEFVFLDQFLVEVQDFIGAFERLGSESKAVVVDVEEGATISPTSRIELITEVIGVLDTIEVGDTLPADGQARMIVRAQVLDNQGAVDHSPKRVRFEVLGADPNIVVFEQGNEKNTINGVAEVVLKAGIKTGEAVIKASVVGSDMVGEQNIILSAGEPASMKIEAASTILPANGQAKSKIRFSLYDSAGNPSTNYFGQLSVFSTGEGSYLDPEADTIEEIPGVQISVVEGIAEIDLISENGITGLKKLVGVLMSSELQNQLLEPGIEFADFDFSQYVSVGLDVKTVDDVSLRAAFGEAQLPANGVAETSFNVELLSGGERISGYEGPVSVKILNEGMGSFVGPVPATMSQGILTGLKLRAGKIAGDMNILIEVPGFASENVALKLLSGPPRNLEFSSDRKTIYTDAEGQVELQASVRDEFGNLAEDSVVVKFEASQATKNLVSFVGSNSVTAVDGVARVKVAALGGTGEVNLVASAAGLAEQTLSLPIKKRVNAEQVANWNPNALYLSVLGGSFGNLADGNNIAQKLLYSGKTEAVLATTSTSGDAKRLMEVDAYGKTSLLDDNLRKNAITSSSSFPYQGFLFSNDLDSQDLAKVFLVPNASAKVSLIGSDEDMELPSGDGIYVQALNADPRLDLREGSNGVEILENGSVKVSVDLTGKIMSSDINWTMDAPENYDLETSNFAVLIRNRGQNIALVHYKQNFGNDVKLLTQEVNFGPFAPGIYLEVLTQKENIKPLISLSGSSSAEANGFYLVDTEQTLEANQSPILNENFGLGFEGDNKNALLFAAGNSVGESNIPYALESAIILGDPMVRLNVDDDLVSELTGYSKDIGEMILAGQDEIQQVMEFNYNDDGFDDLLVVYRDGLVKLLQSRGANGKFRDKGYLMNIFGGITSMAIIDANGDGRDDLLVGTLESCTPNEENHLALYVNENGALRQENFSLNISGLPQEMEARDMNGDQCQDLVVSDTAGNLRVFNNKKSGDECGGLDANYSFGKNYGGDEVSPVLKFDLGNDFTTYPSNTGDGLPDILVKPAVQNPQGITYLYSVQKSDGTIGYNEHVEPVRPDEGNETPTSDADNNALLEFQESLKNGNTTVPVELAESVQNLMNQQNQDENLDGCVDRWNEIAQGLESGASSAADFTSSVAENVQNYQNMFRCSGGGCIPTPFNFAFFAPYDYLPIGFPAVSFTDYAPWVLPLAPTTVPSNLRIYVNPTLTGGLGGAICYGPSTGLNGTCYAYATPIDLAEMIGACPDILGEVNDWIDEAKTFVTNPDIGISAIVTDGDPDQTMSDDLLIDDGGEISNESARAFYQTKANVKIPGFPSVITNWLDAQIDEINNKLLDLPDFYLIYPDFGSLTPDFAAAGSNFGRIQSLNDFMRAVNSLPILQIESQDVVMKVPAISEAEWVKWKRQADAWIRYEENELKKIEALWNCSLSAERRTICDTVTLEMNDFIASVRRFMAAMDKVVDLPRALLTWRTMESKYAAQIIGYMDAIMQYTGGYMRKQQRTVEAWMKAVEDVIRTFKDWKILLDLVIDYQVSCDQCKSDRFSQVGFLMSLFATIPEPPVIPLPKWPDIVLDLSQIRTGVKIIWPDLVFRPEPLRLPNLPVITLPEVLPEFGFNISGIDFALPDLSLFLNVQLPELPDLPPLALPELPNLPRPPKVPKMPQIVSDLAANLEGIFKILCLLKNGLLPVPEIGLGVQIETLTNPSVSAVLPFIQNLAIKSPAIEYDYVEQIKITAKTGLELNTDAMYSTVKKAADTNNKLVKDGMEYLNSWSQVDLQSIVDNLIDDLEARGRDQITYDPYMSKLASNLENLNTTVEEYIATMEVEEIPEKYELVATQRYLKATDEIVDRDLSDLSKLELPEELANDSGMQNLMATRNALLDYAQGIEKMNTNNDLSLLAQNDLSLKPIAALTDERVLAFAEKNGGFATSNEREVASLSLITPSSSNVSERLIAATLDLSENGNNLDRATALSDSGEQTNAGKIGFYVAIGDQNENVLAYKSELKKKVNVLYLDNEADEDTDIVFSMGSNLYLKTNKKVDESQDPGQVKNGTINDFLERKPAPQGMSVPYMNNQKVELVWDAVLDDELENYEVIIFDKLESESEPVQRYLTNRNRLEIDLENGNYYARVYAVFTDGSRSMVSQEVLLSPQVCADREAPLPVVNTDSGGVLKTPLFTVLEIDAGASFDAAGDVGAYYLEVPEFNNGDKPVTEFPSEIWSDNNVALDTDGDGNPANDRSNPIIKIGPFENAGDIGKRPVVLHVVDEAGNSSKQELEIEIFVPSISLDSTVARTGIVTGSIEPGLEKVPFSLMRKRFAYRVVDGKLAKIEQVQKIQADSADDRGKYYTDADGLYEISDLDLENKIEVHASDGSLIAEIDTKTGKISRLAVGYEVVAMPAEQPSRGTRLEIKASNGNVIATIYLVTEANNDVILDGSSPKTGVNIEDLDDEDNFVIKKLPATDINYPGGAAIYNVNENKAMAVLSGTGNIVITDGRMRMSTNSNVETDDLVIINLSFEDEPVARVILKTREKAMIVDEASVPHESIKTVSEDILSGKLVGIVKFLGIDEPDLLRIAKELYLKGVIDGEETGAGVIINPDEVISREEFVKTLLMMLCIVPSEAAYLPYSTNEAGGGFSDIVHTTENLDPYYPYIKEAALRGLIVGYTGEGDIDTLSGLAPFKPKEIISRAEVTKIVIEALGHVGIIDDSSINIGSPWYQPYLQAAQNIEPYVTEGNTIKSNFILTEAEANDPAAIMTQKDSLMIAKRVLDAYNCFELDGENELPERQPSAPDGAVSLELDETPTASLPEKIISGVYIVPGECTTCPCEATIVNSADLLPGDKLFTILSSFDDFAIFAKSNEVLIDNNNSP